MNKLNGEKFFTKKGTVVILAAFCCLLWGSAYPGVKSGYILFNINSENIFSELTFAGYRFIIAGFMVLIFALLSGRKLFSITLNNMKQIAKLGIAQTTIQYIFFYIGLSNTSGVKASVMNALSVFFSVIIAHFIYLNDKMSLKKAAGVLLGFVGVIIVNFNIDLLNLSFKIVGEGFIIIAALIFSSASIYSKKICQSIDPMLVTGYQLFLGGLALLLIGVYNKGYVTNFTLASSSILVYLGMLSAVAFSIWTVLLKYNKIGAIAPFNFLIPVSGAILSSIFLGENIIQWQNAIALILVCLGILIVNE